MTTSDLAAKKRTTKSKSKLAAAEVPTQPDNVSKAAPASKKKVNVDCVSLSLPLTFVF